MKYSKLFLFFLLCSSSPQLYADNGSRLPEEPEILQVEGLEHKPSSYQQEKNSFLRLAAIVTIFAFTFDSLTINLGGRPYYEFHPLSTSLKWVGKGCNYFEILLHSLGL